jgi:enamine deaminase RidA (YjgF/YER057c/UK114 family)
MTRTEITAMRGTDGSRLPRAHVWPANHWDWPFHLPYKHGIKCGRMVYVGGQVSMTSEAVIIKPNDLVAQTRTSMDNIAKVLAGFGLGFDDTVKVNAYYRGGADAAQLKANLSIRSSCFTEPGPTTTGVPLPTLAYPGMMIEIEIVAMTD